MKRYFIILVILFGCKPSEIITVTDTVRLVDKQISYVKEYITNDSIIYDSIPCNPDSIYLTSTVYRTKNIIRVDTILKDKEVIRAEPLNQQLKNEVDKLKGKAARRNNIIFGLIAFIVICGAIVKILK